MYTVRMSFSLVLAIAVAMACDDGSETSERGDNSPPPGGKNDMTPDSASRGAAPNQGVPIIVTMDDSAEEPPQSGDQFEEVGTNPFIDTAEDVLSTFSIDADTASYTIFRRDLQAGRLPLPESVRIEEFVNFFKFDYPAPDSEALQPFSINLEGAPSHFGDGLELLRIGIKGQEIPADDRSPANLVFLVDVSGSMSHPDKIGLVKYSLTTLTNALRPTDTVAIVTYAGSDSIALQPTSVENRAAIFDAIATLTAGGSTHGAAGIQTAYELAEQGFVAGGVNRVVLCTDGDFNVGMTGEPLVQLVESWRDRHIYLSVLGYGYGNLNDAFLEDLTNRAEGNYAFIDNRNEALRVLGDNLVSTIQVIAKDVKIQVEFNPDVVARFRLIGYENRILAHQDFRDDQVDAAEIGSGHFVTAYYELERNEAVGDNLDANAALATVRIRFKAPESDVSDEVAQEIQLQTFQARFDDASEDFRFGAAVVELAEILRHSEHSDRPRFDEVRQIASEALGVESPDRLEFLELVSLATDLWPDP